MQSRDFCFWLQGFFELGGDAKPISAEQAVVIRRHLDLVLRHEIAPLAKEKPAPEPQVPEPAPPPPPAPDPRPVPDEGPGVIPPPTPRC